MGLLFKPQDYADSIARVLKEVKIKKSRFISMHILIFFIIMNFTNLKLPITIVMIQEATYTQLLFIRVCLDVQMQMLTYFKRLIHRQTLASFFWRARFSHYVNNVAHLRFLRYVWNRIQRA
jgi:hypothetical protein